MSVEALHGAQTPESNQRRMVRGAAAIQGAVLALAIVGGAVLRFYALDRRGLVYWDEAKFALEGLRLHVALQNLTGAHLPLVAGKAIGTAKPTHALLIALAYALLGIRDDAPLYLDAACSTASILVVYLLGRRLFSPLIGLVAALLFAAAPFDIIYARSGLSESDAGLLLLVGVLAWSYSYNLSGRQQGHARMSLGLLLPLALSGFLLGAAFTTNYRLILYVGALVGFDLLWSLAFYWRWVPVRILYWGVGLVAMPGLWMLIDAVSRQHGTVLFRSELTTRPDTYWREVLERLQLVSSLPFAAGGQQIQWYLAREGWIPLVLLALGLGAVLWFRSFPWLSLAALIIIPFVGASLSPIEVARTVDEAIPVTCVLIAAALVTLAGRRVWARGVAAVVLVAALIVGTVQSWPLTGIRSGFQSAAAFLNARGISSALTSSEVMVYYFRGNGPTCNAPRLPTDFGQLTADLRAGYRYAVLDYHAQGFMTRVIRHQARRVALYPTLGSLSFPSSLITADSGTGVSEGPYEPYVEVYALGVIHLPRLPGAVPGVCLRDRTG